MWPRAECVLDYVLIVFDDWGLCLFGFESRDVGCMRGYVIVGWTGEI